jgi:hypothetical protein
MSTALVSCMVMVRVLLCAPVFLAFPPSPPLLLFALNQPCRLAVAADALLGMVNSDVFLLLPDHFFWVCMLFQHLYACHVPNAWGVHQGLEGFVVLPASHVTRVQIMVILMAFGSTGRVGRGVRIKGSCDQLAQIKRQYCINGGEPLAYM